MPRTKGVDLKVVAGALHFSHQTVRAMRAEKGSKAARTPPPPEKWRAPLVALARERIEALQAFVRDAEK
jgi:hypothetical protein